MLYLCKIPTEPDTSKIETITAKPQYSLSFIGEQQPQESFTLYFNPSLGNVSSLLVKNDEIIHSDTPLLEYYNPPLEKLIVAKRRPYPHLSTIRRNNQLVNS